MTEQNLKIPKGSENAREFVYEAVKAKILTNEYAPNSSILQAEISDDLGMSRTPVREAIVKLEQDGLVKIVPRHGIQILALEASDMREIYEVLSCLEPKAVELLTERKPDPNSVRELLDACDRMEAALEDDERMAWAQADADFHQNLAALCGNRRLHNTIMSYWELSHRARMFTLMMRPRPVESTREHREVMTAVLAGDQSLAGDLYRRHRERSQETILKIIEEHRLKRL